VLEECIGIVEKEGASPNTSGKQAGA